jgi:hypothetical protein
VSAQDGFIARAEAALQASRGVSSDGGVEHDGVQVLVGGPPPVLDALGRRALVSPLFAGFMWTAVVFRTTLEGEARSTIDPLGLVFRLLAFALTARALILGAVLVRRLAVWRDAARYKLAIAEQGLLLRTPEADFAIVKEDIVDVREHGAWGERSGRRWADVYVVTKPASGRTHIALPPVFTTTPGILAERLMRWRGVVAAPEGGSAHEPPAALPSKIFDAVAAGETWPGTSVIRHGRAYLRRGPYATVLLGLAVASDWLTLPAAVRGQVGFLPPVVVGFALLAVPLVWWLAMRADLKPRKGIALVLTPAEILMRTRAGVHRVAFAELVRLELAERKAWSVLLGAHPQRTLMIRKKDGETITYAEEFLGAPGEVVAALGEAYRKGVAA